jgi:hypothetical protein
METRQPGNAQRPADRDQSILIVICPAVRLFFVCFNLTANCRLNRYAFRKN